jgi:paraquat-inducible protein B
LAIGIWMLVDTILSQGPEITIVFVSGAGVEADKTKIKYRDVVVGLVGSVGLADDLETVVVTAQLDKGATSLLREDTQFWVVRPRIGLGGVSGLGTLLSGGYIQLSPGTGDEGQREFDGLELPPVTPTGTPGLRLTLTSDRAGSVSTGDPVLYKNFRVGRIESVDFEMSSQAMRYGAFIERPYDELVSTASRFWNASGISISLGADGFEVETASLEALLAGGVAFGLPEGVNPGAPAESGVEFKLFSSYKSVNERPYRHGLEYVLRFPQSVRGLRAGAPVEFRGLPFGRVERLMVKEMASLDLEGKGQPVAVLIRLEPGRLELPDTEESSQLLAKTIETAVGNGMRATLATGNLLTGSRFISFDMFPNASPEELGEYAGHTTLPIIAGGLEGIQVRLTSLLDKLNDLPLEELLGRVDRVVADLGEMVASDDFSALPSSLDATLAELRGTLESVSADSTMQGRLQGTLSELDRTLSSLRRVLDTLDEQPNALIFNRELPDDPEPPAGSP